jgi:hypothetical protein
MDEKNNGIGYFPQKSLFLFEVTSYAKPKSDAEGGVENQVFTPPILAYFYLCTSFLNPLG